MNRIKKRYLLVLNLFFLFLHKIDAAHSSDDSSTSSRDVSASNPLKVESRRQEARRLAREYEAREKEECLPKQAAWADRRRKDREESIARKRLLLAVLHDDSGDDEVCESQRNAVTPPPIRQASSVTYRSASSAGSRKSKLRFSPPSGCDGVKIVEASFNEVKYEVFYTEEFGLYYAYPQGSLIKKSIEFDPETNTIISVDEEKPLILQQPHYSLPPPFRSRDFSPLSRGNSPNGNSPNGKSPTTETAPPLPYGRREGLLDDASTVPAGSDGRALPRGKNVAPSIATQTDEEEKIVSENSNTLKKMSFWEHLVEFKDDVVKYKKSCFGAVLIPILFGISMKLYVDELNRDIPKTKKEHVQAYLKKTRELIVQALKYPRQSFQRYPKFTVAVWASLVGEAALLRSAAI